VRGQAEHGALVSRVLSLLGEKSTQISRRCPKGVLNWPSKPCRRSQCPWWVNSDIYMNCSFLASQASAHTLSEIGSMMGISRERVRQIESIAIRKLELRLEKKGVGRES